MYLPVKTALSVRWYKECEAHNRKRTQDEAEGRKLRNIWTLLGGVMNSLAMVPSEVKNSWCRKEAPATHKTWIFSSYFYGASRSNVFTALGSTFAALHLPALSRFNVPVLRAAITIRRYERLSDNYCSVTQPKQTEPNNAFCQERGYFKNGKIKKDIQSIWKPGHWSLVESLK